MSIDALEPEVTEEVTEDPTVTQDPSTDPVEEYKKRNSGLQRKVQQLVAENARLKANTSQPKPETPATETPQPEEDNPLADFLQEWMQERVEDWRDKAIKDYPNVAPLREYLTANTKAGVLELAKDLSEKLGGTTPSEEAPVNTPTPTTSPPAPGPSVPGGSPALPATSEDAEAELAELRKEVRRTGNWAPYLKRSRELAGWEF